MRLVYDRLRQVDYDTLRTFWTNAGGMEATFSFTNPVSNEQKRMRFAREILAWAVREGPTFYTVTVELEEVP